MSAVITSYRVCNRCEDFNVGYATQKTDAEGGFTQVMPIFDSVTEKNTIKLSELVFSDKARGDNIQIFDGDGNVQYFITWTKKSTKEGGAYYWKLSDFTTGEEVTSEITDYTFERGKSFWLSFASPVDFTQSGAVNTNAVVYTVGNGFVQAGNPRATDLKLSELIFSNKTRGDNIQIFDKIGDVQYFITWTKKSTKEGGAYYWKLSDFTSGEEVTSEITDYTFAPGCAFWFSCANEGTVTIPGIKIN